MIKIIKSVLVVAASSIVTVSCSGVKDIVYFQDAKPGSTFDMPSPKVVTVDISDKLSIVVSCKDPELAAVFNLPMITPSISVGGTGKSSAFNNSNGNRVSYYTVDSDGNIDMPVIGTVHVLGLTREQIASVVKASIIGKQMLKDPVVIVEFANMYVSVLGDVAHPGRLPIEKDKVTIIDVLSDANDMTVTGLRNNVKVYRQENGRQVCYQLDFTNMESVCSSPVYYMQQNDIIYVQPNGKKARESTVNGNTVLSVPFWISTSSFLISIATMVIGLVGLKKR